MYRSAVQVIAARTPRVITSRINLVRTRFRRTGRLRRLRYVLGAAARGFPVRKTDVFSFYLPPFAYDVDGAPSCDYTGDCPSLLSDGPRFRTVTLASGGNVAPRFRDDRRYRHLNFVILRGAPAPAAANGVPSASEFAHPEKIIDRKFPVLSKHHRRLDIIRYVVVSYR